MQKRITVVAGDGIGPEVTKEAVRVLEAVADKFGHRFTFDEQLIGGAAIDATGEPLPAATIESCKQSDAILLGAVGGPKWDQIEVSKRPERGLLAIRKEFDLFSNLRPVKAVETLIQASPLKEEIAKDVDLMIVRELTGGLYFGTPSFHDEEQAVDTLQYSREEIERIVDNAFEIAMKRSKRLTSVDKANVLSSSRLWRQIVEEKKVNYPEVEVHHQLVDSVAMSLITNPKAFDVVVTENMFGDILSDEASVITGSLGLLPSASMNGDGFGLYEPVHGSAPDIAGQGKANPAATILSAAMMLTYSFGLLEEAQAIEDAVYGTFNDGLFTSDLQRSGNGMTTTEWTDEVIKRLK
ncbi:MAG TPA: 3-isopropylmalate dehydrogenase [Savagea sp.]